MNAAVIAPQPAPSPAVAAFLKRPPRLLIGGEWMDSKSQQRIPVIDPATGQQIASLIDADQNDVERAVKAARKAFESGPWPDMLPSQRQDLLLKLAGLIDVPGTRDHFRYMAGWATKIEGSTVDTSIGGPPGTKFHAYVRREPVGVCARNPATAANTAAP